MIMKTVHSQREFTLIPDYGWKKDLLMIALSVLLCYGTGALSALTSSVRGISEFDLADALLPLFGFALGIWWAIGYILYSTFMLIVGLIQVTAENRMLMASLAMGEIIPSLLYSMLPAFLWYIFPLRSEKKALYPRLDTCARVVKFYMIMVVSVAIYVAAEVLLMLGTFGRPSLLEYVFWFLQYLDAALIVGIPLLIILSLIRNRTLTINERMVLAFLVIGVIASAMGAYFMYRTTWHLDPSLFEDYEQFMSSLEVTDSGRAAFERYNAYWNRFFVMTAIMLNTLLIIEMGFMYSIEKKVTDPVLRLAEVLEKYARPQNDDPAVHEEGSDADLPDVNGVLDPDAVRESCRPYRYGYGEISSLTRTCVDMVGRIDDYTTSLQQITAEKERIGAELGVASRIQKDMLPGVFPPFPDRREFDLFASMTPAREVGGDFYDFYFVDEDHLALTIADVSGKGIPASLFMVISKTLLKNQAQTGSSPRETLIYVNHQLCQNNEMLMFCTVWLGILDLKTGKLTASNGGHEYPAVKKKDGEYVLMKYSHDPALGVIDGIRYREYEMLLEPGDSLFVYTDGVPEATDAAGELLGEERMTDALNAEPDAGPEQVIERVHHAIRAFVRDEPQFDDITMLCLKYKGKPEAGADEPAVLTVPARAESIEEVRRFITKQLEAAGSGEDDIFAITLAVEEIFANIAFYAYEGGEGDAQISFCLSDAAERTAEIVFADSGMPFDPTARPAPDISLNPGERPIGGLGIHIVRKTMDEVRYEYTGGKNRLTIRKRL